MYIYIYILLQQESSCMLWFSDIHIIWLRGLGFRVWRLGYIDSILQVSIYTHALSKADINTHTHSHTYTFLLVCVSVIVLPLKTLNTHACLRCLPMSSPRMYY